MEPIQKPNIGTPDYAAGRRNKKVIAVVTTVAFAIFWVAGLYLAAEIFAGRGPDLPSLGMAAVGLALGVWGRKQLERE